MFVDRKVIQYKTDGTGYTIDIPLTLDFTPVDNTELVETKFVEDEVKKAINPITDYKKVRLKPAVVNPSTNEWTVVDEYKIKLNFFTKKSIRFGLLSNLAPAYNTSDVGKYGDIGFSTEDLFCRASRVINSYLTLNFYDSTNPSDNNLILFSNIFTQILDEQKDVYGIPLPSNENPVSFRMGDPTLKPNSVHEGFHLYWYEELIKESPNQEYIMYMSATYQNANNGETSIMTPVQTTFNTVTGKANINLNELGGDDGTLYLKVILKYDTTDRTYKYTFEHLNTEQLTPNGGLNMSEVDTDGTPLPTITLWQLAPNGKV